MRNKIVAVIAFMMLLEGAAFANPWPTGVSYKQSNNVDLDYYSNQQNYTINSKHKAGNRVYSTSNNTSNIWYKESDTYKGQTLATTGVSDTTTTGQSVYSGWLSQ